MFYISLQYSTFIRLGNLYKKNVETIVVGPLSPPLSVHGSGVFQYQYDCIFYIQQKNSYINVQRSTVINWTNVKYIVTYMFKISVNKGSARTRILFYNLARILV